MQVNFHNVFKIFERRYKTSFNFESLANIVKRANQTNLRENEKNRCEIAEKEINKAENFVFGEFKIFTWVLVVYCHNCGIALEELVSWVIRRTTATSQTFRACFRANR